MILHVTRLGWVFTCNPPQPSCGVGWVVSGLRRSQTGVLIILFAWSEPDWGILCRTERLYQKTLLGSYRIGLWLFPWMVCRCCGCARRKRERSFSACWPCDWRVLVRASLLSCVSIRKGCSTYGLYILMFYGLLLSYNIVAKIWGLQLLCTSTWLSMLVNQPSKELFTVDRLNGDDFLTVIRWRSSKHRSCQAILFVLVCILCSCF